MGVKGLWSFLKTNDMTEETAKRASELLHELDKLKDIKNETIKEESHWWGFHMPKTLRNEFVNALDRSIEIVKAKIEKL